MSEPNWVDRYGFAVFSAVTLLFCFAVALLRCASALPKGGCIETGDGGPSVTVHWMHPTEGGEEHEQ